MISENLTKEGELLAKLKEVAEMAKVSITTVSRVLNNDPTISVTKETRIRVIESAQKLGYLKKFTTPPMLNIAFLYWIPEQTEIEDIYFKAMREEIQKVSKNYNIEIMTYHLEDGIEQVSQSVNGFIAVGNFTTKELERIEKITKNGVFIDTSPDMTRFDSVRPDLFEITCQGVEHFIKSGHRDIGFIGGTTIDRNTNTDLPDVRETVFRKSMRQAGLLKEEYIFSKRGFTFNTGVTLMERAVEKLGDKMPTAFFVASDAIALGCLQVLNRRGYSVPNRVSLISINDISLAKFVTPPLTTFRIDMNALVADAMKLLTEQIIEGRKYRKKLFLECELIIRRS